MALKYNYLCGVMPKCLDQRQRTGGIHGLGFLQSWLSLPRSVLRSIVGEFWGIPAQKFCLKKEIDLPKRGGLALDLSPESRPIIRGVD